MKRNELKEIATRYGMEIRRNPITDEALMRHMGLISVFPFKRPAIMWRLAFSGTLRRAL